MDCDLEKGFRKLKVWQLAHELTLMVYRVTSSFPKNEIYGLTSQIRRASSSVAANIVEGYSRGTTKQYLNFLSIAKGSLEETKYFVLLAHDLEYLSSDNYELLQEKCNETGRMLSATIKKLNEKDKG